MSDHVAGETRPVHGAHTSPLVGIAAAFKKLWPALAAIPLDAINDHRHPGWDEPFHRATPLMEDFTRAVCEARLVPVEFAEQAILRAEAVVEETIDRLNRRAPECLPGALAPAYLSVSRELENLAALCPAPAAPTSPVPGTTCTPPDEAGGAERGTPKPDAKPDGPFDADGFRFAGIEVKFRRAAKQYQLVLSLWDAPQARPALPRPVGDVIAEVWGDDETEDATFRQLCVDTRRRFQAANCPLEVRSTNGMVHLVRV